MVDGVYQPRYFTERRQVEEWLQDGLPADYDYEANWPSSCFPLDGWKDAKATVEHIEALLRDDNEVYVTLHGCRKEVLVVGVAVHWPAWKPEPTVALRSPLGGKDWTAWHNVRMTRVEAVARKGAEDECEL